MLLLCSKHKLVNSVAPTLQPSERDRQRERERERDSANVVINSPVELLEAETRSHNKCIQRSDWKTPNIGINCDNYGWNQNQNSKSDSAHTFEFDTTMSFQVNRRDVHLLWCKCSSSSSNNGRSNAQNNRRPTAVNMKWTCAQWSIQHKQRDTAWIEMTTIGWIYSLGRLKTIATIQ